MANKITIIGAGQVGSTIAYTLTVKGIATEIVMIDINEQRASGEALDILQGTPFCDPVLVYDGSYQDASGSDIVIITSGVARKPGQTRLDLAQTNVDIMKDIIPKITKYAPDAIYIIVSNPVDILTYQFYKTSGLSPNKIFGSGTILDTARLRSKIANYYHIAQHNVHAYMFGEHGDSSFAPWSLANIATIPLNEYKFLKDVPQPSEPFVHEEIEQFIKKSGSKIIELKGATFFAVAISVAHLCECIDNAMDTTVTVSSMLTGEYGISDVCLSVLSIIGKDGIKGRLSAPLTSDELLKLQHSAECLKSVISQLKF